MSCALLIGCNTLSELPRNPVELPAAAELNAAEPVALESCQNLSVELTFDAEHRFTVLSVQVAPGVSGHLEVTGNPDLDTAIFAATEDGEFTLIDHDSGTGYQSRGSLFGLGSDGTAFRVVVGVPSDVQGSASLTWTSTGCVADEPEPEPESPYQCETPEGDAIALGVVWEQDSCTQRCECIQIGESVECSLVPWAGCPVTCGRSNECNVPYCACDGANCECRELDFAGCGLPVEADDECLIFAFENAGNEPTFLPDHAVCNGGYGVCLQGICFPRSEEFCQ